MDKLDKFIITRKDVEKYHFELENILLAKTYTRKKLLKEADLNLLRLLVRMLVLVIFQKRACLQECTKHKLYYKKKFILKKVNTQVKLDHLLKSQIKLQNFWQKLNTLAPCIISCFIEKDE